jgi:hypothetical protein
MICLFVHMIDFGKVLKEQNKMSDSIIIYLIDDSRIEMNNIISAVFLGDELIVQSYGILGGIDTLVKDGTLIKKFEFTRGKN